MDETGMLDYFYGNEAEQFEFLQVPMILVKDPIYHQGKTALNSDAILLYSFMLNRAKLSRKNGWLDEHNRVFIRYAQKEAEEDLHRKKDAVIEAFRKLENVVPGGLIERREVIKGKPYLIYVKNFRRRIENEAFSSYRKVSDIGKTDSKKLITDVDNFFQNSEKPSTTGRIIRLGQVGKTDPRNIYLKNNNTEKDITSIQSVNTVRDIRTRESKDDANDMTDEYISLIKKNIGYPEMCDTLGSLEGQIYENMYRVIVDTVCSRIPDDCTVSIGKEQKPFRIVKNVFLKLRYEHLELAMMNMDKSRKPVTDMKQYLKTVLYNSYLTIDTQISQDLKSSGVI